MSKVCSASTLTIISSRQFYLCALFDVTLISGQVLHFTSGEVPLNGVTVWAPGGNRGPFNYQTGMTIVISSLSQKSGTEASSMKVAFIPQVDSPNYPILFGGYEIWQAADLGLLAGATVTMSKFYALPPSQTGGQILTAQGAMGFFEGTIQGVEADRFFVDITVEDALSLLGDQQMPRAVFGVGCFHQVYDPGCDPAGTLLASKTVSGTITGVTDNAHITTNLTQVDHYFELGGIQMTSGAANGLRAGISSYLHASGAMILAVPFATTPAVGDTFTAYPGCDRQQATCTNTFGNLVHFAGVPYQPDPSTIVDGGTENPPLQNPGRQAGQINGSQTSSRQPYYNVNAPYKY